MTVVFQFWQDLLDEDMPEFPSEGMHMNYHDDVCCEQMVFMSLTKDFVECIWIRYVTHRKLMASCSIGVGGHSLHTVH